MASASNADEIKPASGALAERVEGWVQYCEYFHLLDAEMQVRDYQAPSPFRRRRIQALSRN